MSNEIATTETQKVTKDLCIQFLKSQHTDLSQGEFEMFAAVAIAFNLNPYLKEIYPIKYGGKMNLITGYQTYIKRAETFPQYDGYDTDFIGEGKNLCCVCNVYRKDRSRPVTAKVYFSEYTQNNSMWNSKPHVMLEKVAIGTAFRRAFPVDLGGMPYTSEEIRAEDELKSQGYTEVHTEQPQHPQQPQAQKKEIDEDTKQFMDGMKGLWTLAPEIYQATMQEFGFKSANNVPPERRSEVFNTIVANISKAQQHQSAPTAMEQAEVHDV